MLRLRVVQPDTFQAESLIRQHRQLLFDVPRPVHKQRKLGKIVESR